MCLQSSLVSVLAASAATIGSTPLHQGHALRAGFQEAPSATLVDGRDHSATGSKVLSTDPHSVTTAPPPKGQRIGLLVALYNANVSTDWVKVAAAAHRVPLRVIIPVQGVTPPDPDWVPDYPSPEAYRAGVSMLRAAGAEVVAYTHLRNISLPCCTCCGNLTQFSQWVDTVTAAASFDGVFLDNMDTLWSSPGYDHRLDGYHQMYAPAAAIVRRKGLAVWSNGPQIRSDGTIPANISTYEPYLALSNFTCLFEMGIGAWEAFPSENLSVAIGWPGQRLGGVVLDLPDNSTGGAVAGRALADAVSRGLGWLYPTIACKHSTGPHRGSCSYAALPTFWDVLVAAVEKLNHRLDAQNTMEYTRPPEASFVDHLGRPDREARGKI